MSEVTFVPFRPENRKALEQLLREAELPVSDLTPELLNEFVVMRANGELVGAGGVERYGEIGLLRSVVVQADQRGTGLGMQLVNEIETRARACGIRQLYLLTATAENFFSARGYAVVPSEQAPAAIRATAEFSHLCPTSSTFMLKSLR